jgi:AmmeMemoRadiSam system protein A
MPQLPEKPLPEQSPSNSETTIEIGEFSRDERSILLRVAHASIEAALQSRELPLDAPSSHLAEPRGAFTTLYHRGQLRGCVGYVFPVASVYRTVAETARAAAFEDTRFRPLSAEEAAELQVHLSILSPLSPIAPAQVEIGRHGLMVSLEGRRGLLLPQVPLEYGWDRATFLEQTCRKAGLPPEAWKQGATLEAFTAEIFGEDDSS